MSTEDDEIQAMTVIQRSLASLESEAQGRIIRWAADRFGVSVALAAGHSAGRALPSEGRQQAFTHAGELDLPTLFHQAGPRTDAERALVVAYWTQETLGQKDWEAQPINSELKNLGHRLSNITDAFSSLIDRKPSYVMQVGKSGSARQARKRYRLTTAGTSYVLSMINGGGDANLA